MQFVKNGPDIPDRLLQAHEDGKVVFFCGAGISSPAGLPGFSGLVDKVFECLNVQPSTSEQSEIKSKQFDRAIGLLERRLTRGRIEVRNCLSLILKPNFNLSNATITHEALLTLSRNRDGRNRIITTNFDRLFEKVIADKCLDIEQFKAPQLPLIKNQWEGVVYLHGLLPDNPSENDLNRLVLSSGDFGLAYLIERWAARFVSDLFRNFTVCFVGYSIDDPVMRYMTDALAADSLLGEVPIEMFAFGSYPKNKKDQCEGEWKDKNVTPILYKKFRFHWYLHKTLREWADVYRDSVGGKESIVAQHAHLLPTGNTNQDDFIGRMMWALRDASGLPAKRFAEFDPVPSLEWIEVFLDDRYRYDDLSQFGVTPDAKPDENLKFSLLSRPTPYTLAQRMELFDRSAWGGWNDGWDKVMRHLAEWLSRHLDDPQLLLRLTRYDLPINHIFAKLIAHKLDYLDELNHNGDTEELGRIRSSAPNAVPRPAMRTLWGLFVAGYIESHSATDFLRWSERFKRDGLTTILRQELRVALAPRIAIRPRFELIDIEEIPDDLKKLKHLVDVEIVLVSNYVYDEVDSLRDNTPNWVEVLAELLDDFCALLREVMDLAREVGEAEDGIDLSWFRQPSIDNHEQNNRFHEWAVLIELSRDAWLATAKISPERAANIARTWLFSPYPVFRRLAYFAAAKSLDQHNDIQGLIQPKQALEWLLQDGNFWLWSDQTKRESMRLLIALAPVLDRKSLTKLERAVLDGPPRELFDAEITPDRWKHIVDLRIFQRLIRIVGAGATLGNSAQGELDELVNQHPDWSLEPKESDEFTIWMGESDEPIKSITTPKTYVELIEWLKQYPDRKNWDIDDWGLRCQEDFDTTSNALCALADDDSWPVERWHEALNVWSKNNMAGLSWQKMMPILAKAPDDDLLKLLHAIGPWLTTVPDAAFVDEELFFCLCTRILEFDYQSNVNVNTGDLVTQAYHHPVGYVTNALMGWWFRNSPKDGEGLPDKLLPIITKLCDTKVVQFRFGRLLLASHVIALFRVDREWTETNLLPLFDWRDDELEAHAVWTGFLKSPYMYTPFLEAIKSPILDTASHYEKLDMYGKQYVDFLSYIALLNPSNIFTKQQLAKATGNLPVEGLTRTVSTLCRALDSAGDQSTEYWRNRIQPYLKSIWPKSVECRTPKISQKLGELCTGANDAFPEALEQLESWLLPSPRIGIILRRLIQFGICSKFPEEALRFLHLVTGEPPWGDDLKECLLEIKSASPELENSPKFIELVHRFRSAGGDWE